MKFFNEMITFINNNQFLVAGLGVSGFGLVSFWLKDVPLKLFSFLKRHLTTELTVQNFDVVFYDLLRYIQESYKHKQFRTLRLMNGKWGHEECLTSIGYGDHFIFYKGNILWINYSKNENTASEKIKEAVTITKLGRSKKLFEKLILDIVKANEKDTNSKLYKYDDGWIYTTNLCERPLKTIFIEEDKKNLLLNSINKFKSKEKWYINNGIPYQFGVLLYGPPGTGKTSIIKAIASYLNYNVYYLPPSQLGNIQKALSSCSEKSIVVIEDIDSASITHSREKSNTENTIDLFSLNFSNISDILNALDGLNNIHGRFLICTTNHIEKLDKALIRPGRIDLILEIGYVNIEILKQFFCSFFSEFNYHFDNLIIKKNITVAELQNYILLNMSPEEIINKIKS